jgi:hypothetical protein
MEKMCATSKLAFDSLDIAFIRMVMFGDHIFTLLHLATT